MDNYFSKLNQFLFSKKSGDEIFITNISGENSQFIRFNNSKVRQTGIVDDMNFSITLLSNNRKCSISMTLTGDENSDKLLLESYLNKLRDDVENIPEDPFIVYPVLSESSKEKYTGSLLEFKNAADHLVPIMN